MVLGSQVQISYIVFICSLSTNIHVIHEKKHMIVPNDDFLLQRSSCPASDLCTKCSMILILLLQKDTYHEENGQSRKVRENGQREGNFKGQRMCGGGIQKFVIFELIMQDSISVSHNATEAQWSSGTFQYNYSFITVKRMS